MKTEIKIGDLINKAGIYTEPGVVVEKKGNGQVVIDTQKEIIDHYHRHTNTSGLPEYDKDRFNDIIDGIEGLGEREKVEALQAKIDDLKNDLANKPLVQYLRNQQAFLVQKSKKLPRTYAIDERKILI